MGTAAGGNAVSHTDLVVHPFAQTQILTAVGATGFTNAHLVSNLTVSSAGAATKAITTGILRPLDAIQEAASRFTSMLTTTTTRDVLDTVLPYTSTKLGTLLPVGTLWQDRVANPLATLLGINPNATMAQIVTALNSGLPSPAFAVVADDLGEKSISFNLNAANFTNVLGSAPTASGTLNLGSGYALSAGGAYTVTGNLVLSGVIGLDMTKMDDLGSALFIRNLNLNMGASGSIANLNANVTIGTITAAIENGSFSLSASANVAMRNPTGGNQVSLKEIVHALPNYPTLATITPTASIDMRLPLNLTNTATNFNLANFGRPVISAASQNLFAGTPDVIVDIDLGPALQDQILSMLSSLDQAADSVSSRSAFETVIPGIGRSLNGILNEPGSTTNRRWGDLLKFESAASDYFESFNPASLSFVAANAGRRPTILGLRNAVTNRIDQVTKGLFSASGGASPVSLRGGVDLVNNRLNFDLVVNGSFTRAVNINLDTLGSQWTNIGVNFRADAMVNVVTTVDLGLNFGLSLSSASGADPFFNLNRFNLNSLVSGNGSSFGFSIGGNTITGSITATTLQITAGATIALANNGDSIANRLIVTPAGSVNLNLAFNASIYNTNLLTGTNALPRVQVVDTLFDSSAPSFTLDVAPLMLNLSGEALLNALVQLATWLSNVTGSSSLSTKIPLLNKSVANYLPRKQNLVRLIVGRSFPLQRRPFLMASSASRLASITTAARLHRSCQTRRQNAIPGNDR